MRKLFFLFVLWITMAFVFSQCGRQADVVAKVGNEKITLAEFKSALGGGNKKLENVPFKKRMATLQKLIDERLLVLKGREAGLDKDPNFTKEINARADRIIARKFYEEEVFDKIIPDSLIRIFYDLQQYNIRLVAIVLGYKDSNRFHFNRTKEEAIALANELKRRIEKGESVRRLAEMYSDEPGARTSKGVVNMYSPGMFALEVAVALHKARKDELVGPVVTDQGVFLLKIEGKKRIPGDLGFDEMKEQIKSDLARQFFRRKAHERYLALAKEFARQYSYEILDDGIQAFLDSLKQIFTDTGGKRRRLSPKARQIVLAKFRDQDITADYLVNLFFGRISEIYGRYGTLDQLKKLLQDHIYYLAWVAKAREKGIDREPDVARRIESLRRQLLLRRVQSELIRRKVTLSEEELMAYYSTHKANYVVNEKIQVWDIPVKSEKLAREIYRRALRGEDFQKLAKKYAETSDLKNRKGYLGYRFRRARMNEVTRRAFKAGPNKIIEPFQVGAYYHVVKTGKYEPSYQKSFQDVRAAIESELRTQKERQMKQQLIEELRKKHVIWINESLVRKLS